MFSQRSKRRPPDPLEFVSETGNEWKFTNRKERAWKCVLYLFDKNIITNYADLEVLLNNLIEKTNDEKLSCFEGFWGNEDDEFRCIRCIDFLQKYELIDSEQRDILCKNFAKLYSEDNL